MSVTTLSTRWPRLGLGLNDFFEPWSEWFQDGALSRSLTVPTVNITEDKTSYNLSLAAPGLTKKDFKIDVEGNLLTISAQKEENKEEKDKSYTRREYNFSSFSRSFTLPEGVEQDKIDASYTDGVLKLAIPKNEKAHQKNHKEIAIK
jgi:HSP20 family protein